MDGRRFANMSSIAVYSILNRVNGKQYIGGTIDTKSRWLNHKNSLNNNIHFNRCLQEDWNKFGENAFDFLLLEPVSAPDELVECELRWFLSLDNLYNINKPVGENHNGSWKMPSDEIKQQMSISRKGEKHFLFGKHHTPETISKIVQARKGQNAGEKNCMYQKHHTDECKKLISEKNRAYYATHPNPKLGVPSSEETRKRISLACKEGWAKRKAKALNEVVNK